MRKDIQVKMGRRLKGWRGATFSKEAEPATKKYRGKREESKERRARSIDPKIVKQEEQA